MRAADDALHSENMQHMRDTSAEQPVRDEFIAALQPLTAEALEREGDALRFAKIGVLSNMERHVLNYAQARAFAKRHNRPLVWWRQELTGMAAGWLSADEQEKMFEVEREGLCFFFVEGAPASITHNIETGRGLVNGCDATLHSLTMPDGFNLDDHVAQHAEVDGGVTEVFLGRGVAPVSVNAVPHVSPEARAELLGRGVTLKGESVVLTLPCSQLSGGERAELDALGAVARGRSLAVRAESVSDERRASLLARGASIDGELVVPVLVGESAVKYTTTSTYAAQQCVPKVLHVRKHQIDLGFVVTDYKVQSKTLDYFILCIGPRAGIKPALTLTDLYVVSHTFAAASKC